MLKTKHAQGKKEIPYWSPFGEEITDHFNFFGLSVVSKVNT